MTVLSTIQSITLGFVELVANSDSPPPTFPGGDVDKAIQNSSATFAIVQRVFAVIGIGVVIWTAKGVIQALVGAKPVDAAKKLVGGLAAAVLCFRLSLPLSLVTGLGNLLEQVFKTFNDTLK